MQTDKKNESRLESDRLEVRAGGRLLAAKYKKQRARANVRRYHYPRALHGITTTNLEHDHTFLIRHRLNIQKSI